MSEASVTDRTAVAILREMKRHHDTYAEFARFTREQYGKTQISPTRILGWLALGMLLWFFVFGYSFGGTHYQPGCSGQ